MLIAEREDAFAHAWRDLFTKERFAVDIVDDGRQAVEQLRGCHYDVIILPAGAPLIDGIDLCRNYRTAGGSSPILLTTARHDSEEMECGLEAGADDYMAKPIKLRELWARVRALLRRPAVIAYSVLRVQEVVLDSGKGTVMVAGKELHLHPMELNLLEFFMVHQNQVFSAEALLDRVWKDRSKASLASVRTHIKTLRQKLHEMRHPTLIVTVRGRGYKIVS